MTVKWCRFTVITFSTVSAIVITVVNAIKCNVKVKGHCFVCGRVLILYFNQPVYNGTCYPNAYLTIFVFWWLEFKL